MATEQQGRSDSPLLGMISQRLAHSRYDNVFADWQKAISRLEDDRDGAVTAARTLMETTCKLALEELGGTYEASFDLPKLYHAASTSLGVSPTQQTDQLFRSVFGAAQTIITRVGEMRNKFGDAHGKGQLSLPVPRHHAELAINLAGSICCFLVSSLESAIAARKLKTSAGEVILKFDVATVWRLVDHSRNSPESMPWYGRTRPKRTLLLVGDSGIYLMSNGLPAMDESGNLIKTKKKATGIRRLVATALGCDPSYNAFEDWWPIHNTVDDGSDFSIPISIKEFEKMLPTCKSQIIIVLGPERYRIISDSDFAQEYSR